MTLCGVEARHARALDLGAKVRIADGPQFPQIDSPLEERLEPRSQLEEALGVLRWRDGSELAYEVEVASTGIEPFARSGTEQRLVTHAQLGCEAANPCQSITQQANREKRTQLADGCALGSGAASGAGGGEEASVPSGSRER